MARKIQDDPRPRRESGRMWRSAPRPVDWPARVEAVLARDRVCQQKISADGSICGNPHDLECDHIGDPTNHELSNLQALCSTHHKRKTARQGAEARNRRRIPRKRPPEKHPGLID
jgi:5-methylcytosine-specific restriction protein A